MEKTLTPLWNKNKQVPNFINLATGFQQGILGTAASYGLSCALALTFRGMKKRNLIDDFKFG